MRESTGYTRSGAYAPDLGQLETLMGGETYAFPVDQEYKDRTERQLVSIHVEPYRDIVSASEGETKVRYRERSPTVERYLIDDVRWMGLRIVRDSKEKSLVSTLIIACFFIVPSSALLSQLYGTVKTTTTVSIPTASKRG
jgi:hypothetical protein